MSIVTGFLIFLLVVFAALGLTLGFVLVRLSGELKRLDKDSETLTLRLQRRAKTLQIATALAGVVQKGVVFARKRTQSKKRKDTYGKKSRKK